MKAVLRSFSCISARLVLFGCALVLLGAASASAQQGTEFEIDFTNPSLVPPHWTLRVHSDGTGHFDSDGGAGAALQSGHMTVADLHRDIKLSAAVTSQIFATAHSRNFFNFPCESHMKVAFQGTKHISYTGPDGSGSCSFNYAKDRQIEDLGNTLMGVEATILIGARLEMLLLHDRLGLDQELQSFTEALHSGNAADPSVISDTLTRIANDNQVMDRARKRARLLLAAPR